MGFLDGAGMAGATGGANQALQNFLKFYMQNKQLGLEREKYGEQKLNWAAERAEKARLAAKDVEYQKGYDALYAPTERRGLMSEGGPTIPQGEFAVDPSLDITRGTGQMVPGNPSIEQLLNLQGKYSPDKTMTSRVSMANTEANTTSREKIRDLTNKNDLEKLALKQEQAQKLFEITQNNKFKIAADKAASGMALLMERMQGMKDIAASKTDKAPTPTDHDKLYTSYIETAKLRGEKIMPRYEFNIWMAKQKPDRFDEIKSLIKEGQGGSSATTTRKPLSSFGR